MNKTLKVVGAGVGAGVLSKGITGMVQVSNPVKIGLSLALAFGAGYLASKEKEGTALQGAYMGICMAQSFEGIKAIASTPAIQDKLNPDTKFGQFGQKALGLSGVAGALNGGFDSEGNYIEGLNAYTPEGEYYDEGLNAYNEKYDEGELNAYNEEYEDEGLNAYDEEYDGEGLNAYDDEEEGLGAYGEIEIA